MKLKGPFSVKIHRGRPHLLDGAGRHLLRVQFSAGEDDDVDTARRIAAALNRDAKARRLARLPKTNKEAIAELQNIEKRIRAGAKGLFTLFTDPTDESSLAFKTLYDVKPKHAGSPWSWPLELRVEAIHRAIAILKKKDK